MNGGSTVGAPALAVAPACEGVPALASSPLEPPPELLPAEPDAPADSLLPAPPAGCPPPSLLFEQPEMNQSPRKSAPPRILIQIPLSLRARVDKRPAEPRGLTFEARLGSSPPQGCLRAVRHVIHTRQATVTKVKQALIWLGLLLAASACKRSGRAGSAASSSVSAHAAPSASTSASQAASASEPNEPTPEPLHDPLLIAAAAGDLSTIKKLLAEHANLAVQEGARSAIVLAAEGGHQEVVALLLRQNVPQTQAEKALVYASGAGNIALIKLFLDKKVSPNGRGDGGISPLILSGYAGKLEAVELLLARGADPNQVNDDQEAPLHTCAVNAAAEQIVPLLLKKGARVDVVDKYGRTPLSNQAQDGNSAAVRALLGAGAELEHRDGDQQTPLFSACMSGHDAIVAELLARHADPNVINRFGATPLMAAAAGGHLAVVRQLLAAGATLEQRLVKNDQSALELAIVYDHAEVVAWLLDHGMDARGRAGDRTPPIMVAAYRDGVKSIPVLVAHGADPNLLVASDQTVSISPLMGACAFDHNAAARALLDAGAKVNLTGRGGASALHLAAVSGSVACVELLLAKGAILDARNDANGTPLRSASEKGQLAAVKLLLSRGAKPDIRDTMGLLPIDYARKGGHTAVVEALSAAK